MASLTLPDPLDDEGLLLSEGSPDGLIHRPRQGGRSTAVRVGLPAALSLAGALGVFYTARGHFIRSAPPAGVRFEPASSPQRLFEDENTDEAPIARLSAPPMPPALKTDLGECPATNVVATPKSLFGVPQPSEGCSATTRLCEQAGEAVMESIDVFDAQLGISVTRHYAILVPESACNLAPGESSPLMLWFHGQTGDAMGEAEGWATASGYRSCAYQHGWISVYPMGLGLSDDAQALGIKLPSNERNESETDGSTPGADADPPMRDLGTGWNVGVAGDDSTCLKEEDRVRAFRYVKATEYSCYPTCQAKGLCGRCNWSTCHDDLAFVKTLLKHLQQKYCIDRSRIYLGGQSNGGMLTHYLSQAMPGVFAALNPIYGLPLLGYAEGKHGELFRHQNLNTETAIIEFHDRGDTTIPLHGGPAPTDGWAWYYTPLEQMMSIWATVHGCDEGSTDVTEMIKTACPQVASTVTCREHLNCGTGRRVLNCVYDGVHGDSPRNKFFGCASVWFFNQFRRTTPVAAL